MFKAAFGDAEINSQRMLKALAQFTGTLISANSKYDKVKEGEAVFTPFEEKGYMVFKSKSRQLPPGAIIFRFQFQKQRTSFKQV